MYVNSGQQGVGGILGSASYKSGVTITDVYNTGNVTASGSASSATYAGVGGIAGYIYATTTIKSAYNAGTVSATTGIPHGSVLGNSLRNTNSLDNCYWLAGTDEKMFSGVSVSITGDTAEASTSDALKALYTALGDGFKQDAGNVNSGYPVLDWQESVGEPEIVSIKITHAPYKTNYTAGESFDKTGMTVAAVYDNDTTKPVDDFTVETAKT